MLRFISLATVILLLSACAYPVGPRQGTATLLGAGTGALLGSQFGDGKGRLAAVALGTLAGAMIGQDIGRTLDEADRSYMQRNAQSSLETLPSNQSGSWVNPDTGHSGSLTPTATYQTTSGQYCREYQQTVVINGEEQQAYGTACRQPDGSWKIVPAEPQVQGQVVQPRTETRYVPVYQDSYGYYPWYYWPSTSLSFSYGYSSGHRHHDRGGYRHHRGYWYGD